MFIKLTQEQVNKIKEARAEFGKKYNDALKERSNAIKESQNSQVELKEELEKTRQKYIKLNEQIKACERVAEAEANRTFHEKVAVAKRDMDKLIEEVHKEARQNTSDNYVDPFETLFKLMMGLDEDKQSNSKTDVQDNTEKLKTEELTEEEMLDYIHKAELHKVAELYYELSCMKISKIRKERVCEKCGATSEPYSNMIVTMAYYDKATGRTFNDFWDADCEVSNHNGVIDVVDECTGEVITLARKTVYRDIKCVYESVKEAEKLTAELMKCFSELVDIGYTEE